MWFTTFLFRIYSKEVSVEMRQKKYPISTATEEEKRSPFECFLVITHFRHARNGVKIGLKRTNEAQKRPPNWAPNINIFLRFNFVCAVICVLIASTRIIYILVLITSGAVFLHTRFSLFTMSLREKSACGEKKNRHSEYQCMHLFIFVVIVRFFDNMIYSAQRAYPLLRALISL